MMAIEYDRRSSCSETAAAAEVDGSASRRISWSSAAVLSTACGQWPRCSQTLICGHLTTRQLVWRISWTGGWTYAADGILLEVNVPFAREQAVEYEPELVRRRPRSAFRDNARHDGAFPGFVPPKRLCERVILYKSRRIRNGCTCREKRIRKQARVREKKRARAQHSRAEGFRATCAGWNPNFGPAFSSASPALRLALRLIQARAAH